MSQINHKIPSNTLVLGYIYAIITVIFWSGNFVVSRLVAEDLSAVAMAFYRWVMASLLFLPIAASALIKEWRSIWRYRGYLALTSMVGISCYSCLVYLSGKTTQATNLALIAITFPVWVLILSRIFYKEHIGSNKYIGIICVVLGVILLVTGGNFSSLSELAMRQGDAYMLVAAFLFAIYNLLVKQKPAELSVRSLQMLSFSLGALFILPFYIYVLISDSASISSQLSSHATLKIIGAVLYVSLFCSVLSYALWAQAIGMIGAIRTGFIYYLMPIFSGLVAWLWLGEALSAVHLISSALIIFGIIIASRN